jgi:Ser/Thr protein kinase RdoA (MazF antagonist)
MTSTSAFSRDTEPLRAAAVIARRFLGEGALPRGPGHSRDDAVDLDLAPLGEGLINDTFRLCTASGAFVLQRINASVFPDPELIMRNLEALYAASVRHPELRVRVPAPVKVGGRPYVRDTNGELWRLTECIEPSSTLKRLDTAAQAKEVGRTLGRFHRLGGMLDPATLAMPLPGFHDTPSYLAELDQTLDRAEFDDETRNAYAFIDARRDLVPIFSRALDAGAIQRRVVHGDPKVDNLLFDPSGERALCLIDLDTVQPGLPQHDIGDCLRSCCNRGGEAGEHSVRFDLELCAALLMGYAETAASLLSRADRDLIAPAIRLIPLELGIRFLTDHLQGDRYFRVRHRGDNLTKARRQLALVADIERQAAGIDAAIQAAFHPID